MSRTFQRSTIVGFAAGLAVFSTPGLTVFASGDENALSRSSEVPASLRAAERDNWTLNERFIAVPRTNTVLRTYDKLDQWGNAIPHYAISSDGGETWSRDRATSYQIQLRYATFDPLVTVPAVNPALAASADNRMFIVQFITQPLEEFRNDLKNLGTTVRDFVGHHAYIVEMDPSLREDVLDLPYVRWVGAFQPAYKTEERLLNEFYPMDYGLADDAAAMNAGGAGQPVLGPQNILASNKLGEMTPANGNDPVLTLNVMVFERGLRQKRIVANKIRQFGGQIDNLPEGGFLLRATIRSSKLARMLAINEVAFADLWSPPEDDMDIARQIGGANTIENTLGFTGQGVHAEVMDGNIHATHNDFQNPPITIHGPRSGDDWHGTSTSGIVYGDGSVNSKGRGMLPDAEKKIFADYSFLSDRHKHTAELVDPNGPYRAVLQSNSWGDARTRDYTTVSADMDDLLFLNDIIITQSQSNAGNQDSRPQAWAKNIVSVGGVNHRDTLTKSDDCWCSGGSIGPAKDGRIKPDLTHFYDNIFTTTNSSNTAYTSTFGGTSGATPIVAGHFGLVFQMWHEQVFAGFGGGATVFDDRPHMSTAKALIINSSDQYPFSSPSEDHSRVKQGWGMPQLENLVDNSPQMLIVNETDILKNLQKKTYLYPVVKGRAELKITLVYSDPKGTPFSSPNRVNDLSLKVTSPGGTVYWGNNGLLNGNYSTPGGISNTIDTVENVFVERPEDGNWTVEVLADEIIEDSHLETNEVDADFALVAAYSTAVAPACMDLTVDNLVAGQIATFTVSKDLARGETVAIVWGTGGNPTEFNNFAGYCATFGFSIPNGGANSRVVGQGFVDQNGEFIVNKKIPGNLSGMSIMFQAAKKGTCPSECMSNLWEGQIQ